MQIQDLDLMIRELGDEKAASAEKKMGFELSGPETLNKARQQLAKKVEGEWLRAYDRIAKRYPRAIVPVRDGICFGCFTRQPSKSITADSAKTDELEICQRCGRIMFRFPA